MTAKLSTLSCACALSLAITSTQAETIDSVRNSGIGTTNDPQRLQTWLFSPDTNNPIELDSANTYVLYHNWSIRDSLTVVGQLNIASGALQAGKNSNLTWTMSTNTVLSGGTLNGNVSDKTLTVNGGGFDFSLQSGTLTAVSTATLLVSNANLSGAGDIDVTGAGTVTITANTTGFTGSFNVTGSTFDLDTITTASFGLSLSSAGSYANDADAAFTSLTIMGSVVANDTYTRSELLAYGTSEYSQDWSAFVADGGGNITVVPELGSYALLGGCLALAWVMVRRRRG